MMLPMRMTGIVESSLGDIWESSASTVGLVAVVALYNVILVW